MVVVGGDRYRSVVGVHRAVRLDYQLLERSAAPVGHRIAVQLSVIRYGPDDRLPEDEQQFHARVHRLNPFRYLRVKHTNAILLYYILGDGLHITHKQGDKKFNNRSRNTYHPHSRIIAVKK